MFFVYKFRFQGPHLVLRTGASKLMCLQAGAVWQWYHATRVRFSDGKPLLMVNMDETAICSFQGYFQGNVVAHRESGEEPIQPYNRGRRRLHVSYCCFICNNRQIQKRLPQVILMNEKACSNAEYARLLQACPSNVYVKRSKSAWNNEEIMCIMVRLLHVHLKDVWNDYHIVLFLDAFGGHIHHNVQVQCNRCSIVLIIIPANLTWLLQPCDTHVFSIFKNQVNFESKR